MPFDDFGAASNSALVQQQAATPSPLAPATNFDTKTSERNCCLRTSSTLEILSYGLNCQK